MEERVDYRGVVLQLGRRADIVLRIMARRQFTEDAAHFCHAFRRLLYANPPESILKHVDTGADGLAVEHQHHDTIRREHPAQRGEAGRRVGQMMQHASAQNYVELPFKRSHLEQIALEEVEVSEPVPLLQEPFVCQRSF